jgi:predicted benzoate:H+ symporter BenE
MTNLHQQIDDLEAEIDALSDAAERCRKSIIVAKVAVIVGIVLFAISLLGLVRSDGTILVIGIAVAIAGIGLFGSSRGSMDQLMDKIRVREARRAEMIDGMNLQVVQDQ